MSNVKIFDATEGDLSYQTVNVVGVTKSLVEGIEGAQELVAYMARVSNPDNQMNTKTSGGLLRYCARNSHWSIFEMVNIQLEITTTRDIARQLLRHYSVKFQEFSQRYANPVDDLFFVIRECRMQDEKNRQNSKKTDDEIIKDWWRNAQLQLIHKAKDTYDDAVKSGVAKEQARSVLPEGNTGSKLYANMNLRSIITYCNMRRGNGTQAEHIDLANKIWEACLPHFNFLTELDKKETN